MVLPCPCPGEHACSGVQVFCLLVFGEDQLELGFEGCKGLVGERLGAWGPSVKSLKALKRVIGAWFCSSFWAVEGPGSHRGCRVPGFRS